MIGRSMVMVDPKYEEVVVSADAALADGRARRDAAAAVGRRSRRIVAVVVLVH